MKIEQNFSLEHYNSFHLPVKTRWFMEYETEEELGRILRDEYFQECYSVILGGGNNQLFLNDLNGIVLHSQIRGREVVRETDQEVWLRCGAAEKWDEIVAFAVSRDWGGLENLSLIPAEMGGAIVQNIGAYGAELQDVVECVEAYNQLTFEKRIFDHEACGFGYRDSFFKDPHHDPYIITYVTLRLQKHPTTFQLDYGDLKQRLSGHSVTLAAVREAVISIRKEKLPDPDEIGNAGSFFKNPVISAEQFAKLQAAHPEMRSYPTSDDKVKVPAGWLIEQCGFKGKRHGTVGVYEKQALVLVNLGDATGHEIALVAESIRTAVQEQFGIELIPEVNYIG